MVWSPDLEVSEVIPHRMLETENDETRVAFTVPRLETYNLVVVRPRGMTSRNTSPTLILSE